MSRGLGALQRRLLGILYEGSGGDMPVREIKASVGGDRANSRRALRNLASRGLIVETEAVGGERGVRLTFVGSLVAMPRVDEEPDPFDEFWALREAAEDQLRAIVAEQRRARQEAAEASRRRRRGRRRLRLGRTQRLILAVLSQGIDGELRALETTYLKSLVTENGGTADKSNLRRAVRALVEIGYLEERNVDGWRFYELTLFGLMRSIPLDPATAPRLFDLP